MHHTFFDPLMHIKVDPKWYKTEKQASVKDIKSFNESGALKGGVIACMPDDDPETIAGIVKSELPFCRLVISIKNEWLSLSERELVRLFKQFKEIFHCVGIKIHPRLSLIALDDAPVVDRIILTAHKCGLMVYICTILRAPVGLSAKPLHHQIASIADRNTLGDIVFLHGGYTDVFHTGEIIRDYPHAWLDLSFTFMRFRKSSLALDCGYLMETLDRKLMIGTDFPEYTPQELICALEHYVFSRRDLNLTDQKINNVLCANIESLINKYDSYN